MAWMVFVILLELTGLFFLSQALLSAIYGLFLLITRSRSIAVTVVTLLIFPGTVVHELSHLFTAEVLGVRTGKFSVVPESIDADDINTGSVAIASTDPFRRYAIGLAPFFSGILTLTALSYVLPSLLTNLTVNWQGGTTLTDPSTYYLLILLYGVFAVSNSMFSSPSDLKGFLPFALTVGIMAGAAYVTGVRIQLTGQAALLVTRMLDTLTKSLGFVAAVNIVLLTISLLLGFLVMRLRNVRLVRKS